MGTGRLTIDLDAISANWRGLDALSGAGVETAAVVKADAYGLGAGRVAAALNRAGARTFFVATSEEGAEVRRSVGPGPMIGVFSGHMAGDTDLIARQDLTPMLSSPEQFDRHHTALPGRQFGVQLDTGMNRLGVEPADWADLSDRAVAAGPVLAMSHLACADEPDHPMNAQQLRVFRAMTDRLGLRRSLAATGGILLGPDYHFDLTRPGVGLYGGQPFADACPVVRLSLPVVQTRRLAPGATVGYGNAWTATAPTVIATLSAGYADGLIRAMSGRASLYHGATPCPLRGRVSMDLLTVDVTHLDPVPDALDILCGAQSVDDLADAAGTIGYEVLTSLGRRYSRAYTGA